MPFLMQLQDVEEAGGLAPVLAENRPGEVVHLGGPKGGGKKKMLGGVGGDPQRPGAG